MLPNIMLKKMQDRYLWVQHPLSKPWINLLQVADAFPRICGRQQRSTSHWSVVYQLLMSPAEWHSAGKLVTELLAIDLSTVQFFNEGIFSTLEYILTNKVTIGHCRLRRFSHRLLSLAMNESIVSMSQIFQRCHLLRYLLDNSDTKGAVATDVSTKSTRSWTKQTVALVNYTHI